MFRSRHGREDLSKMRRAAVFRVPMAAPDDMSGLTALLDTGAVQAQDIVAILAKTEGNGCVNDYARGFAATMFAHLLAERLGISKADVEGRVALVMSGGTEGVMSPHATLFAMQDGSAERPAGSKRLTIGVAFTRDFRPEEIGRLPMVEATAEATQAAMRQAGITNPEDVHFVQVKCPLLRSDRIAGSEKNVVTTDTYESMGYSRGASALGVAAGLGEIDPNRLRDADVLHDWSLYSSVASASAGVELLNNEVIVMGNSADVAGDLCIGHSVMRDAIDAEAVREALRSVGLSVNGGLDPSETGRLVNVLAKAEPDPSGSVRGRRSTMLDDSDINSTRHARAVVNAVIASVVGDPMLYVSGGAEHQGPAGGGPVAAIARARPE
jgi:cyanuric acid amidohydrolase